MDQLEEEKRRLKLKRHSSKSDKVNILKSTYVNNLITRILLSLIIFFGLIVFIGEKEGLGNTLIIQGIDETDYWYSNIENSNFSLYDYVSKGELLGITKTNKLYLTFQKKWELFRL